MGKSMIKAVLQSDPKYVTTTEIDEHVLILDEPVSLGGNNQGPTPVGTVFAALSGCISMTLRMYADRKKWPLERIEVTIENKVEPVQEDDPRFVETPWKIHKGRVRFIHANVIVSGPLEQDQVKRLDDIAGKCPVHVMLKQGSHITHDTTLAP